MIHAGVALVDITPTPGLAMAGFAARSHPATGTHDALTVRAIAINDTCIVVADVVGIHGVMSASVRARCCLPAENVVITALHNHGGPASMPGRLGIPADPAYLERLEDACVTAIDRAVANRRPASMTIGWGADPKVARNRRHAQGPVDDALPVLRIRGADGTIIAVMTSYACHPVVLGADNLLWTADYPHYVRATLERSYPGAMALFLTGCAGDANTGHSAHASITLASSPERSFATAERLGATIARAAISAPEQKTGATANVTNSTLLLEFERRETEMPPALAERWSRERANGDAARQAVLDYWVDWANTVAGNELTPIATRVTVLDWGGVAIVAMPGEIFAETALSVRATLGNDTPSFVVCFADDNPGYIPPASEFEFGGYEIDEAHRYYGQPATFAPGSAEKLAANAINQLALRKYREGRI